MKWLIWLLLVGWVGGLLTPPLPPLPIETIGESSENHKFNIDGSPDEELQLSLNEDKSDEITPITTIKESIEEEKLEVPEPPEEQSPPSQNLKHIGPPSIRPPLPTQSVEELKSSEEIVTTEKITTSSTTIESTTTLIISTMSSPTTNSTVTTAIKKEEPTDEPRVLIPAPEERPLAISPDFGESKEFIVDVKKEKKIENLVEEEPMVLIPPPDEVTHNPNELKIIIPTPEESPEKTVTMVEPPSRTNEESTTTFFTTPEPMITVPLPEIAGLTQIPSMFTVAKVLPFDFKASREIIVTQTSSLPQKKITEAEMLDDLVKGLPNFEGHQETRIISTTSLPVTSKLHTTRRIGDVVIEVVAPQRTLHRGQLRKLRRKGNRENNRRLLRIRPPTKMRKPHPFRNSSDIVRRPKAHHKVRRIRKKNGVSRVRISNP